MAAYGQPRPPQPVYASQADPNIMFSARQQPARYANPYGDYSAGGSAAFSNEPRVLMVYGLPPEIDLLIELDDEYVSLPAQVDNVRNGIDLFCVLNLATTLSRSNGVMITMKGKSTKMRMRKRKWRRRRKRRRTVMLIAVKELKKMVTKQLTVMRGQSR